MAAVGEQKADPLTISWFDSAWIPILNSGNVMDYFSERTNPFYDRTCSNEVIKMQRLNPDQLQNMTGIEYVLLHVQDPILYVIRKQHRHSPTQVTPIAEYYCVAGVVYQAPDICSVLNSRLLNTFNVLQSAFDETASFSKYHPSRGYWWEFKDQKAKEKPKTKEKKEEPSSLFQRHRVDVLLGELSRKFPLKPSALPSQGQSEVKDEIKTEPKVEIKSEKTDDKSSTASSLKAPPEKKPKLGPR